MRGTREGVEEKGTVNGLPGRRKGPGAIEKYV